MNCAETSLLWRINVCFMALGLFFSLLGFGTNHIVDKSLGHSISAGLWKICVDSDCHDVKRLFYYSQSIKDGVLASRGLLIASLCLQALTILANGLLLALTSTRIVNFMGAALAICATLIGAIGGAVFVVRFQTNDYLKLDPSWSFYVLMSGCGLYLASSIVQAIQLRSSRR